MPLIERYSQAICSVIAHIFPPFSHHFPQLPSSLANLRAQLCGPWSWVDTPTVWGPWARDRNRLAPAEN